MYHIAPSMLCAGLFHMKSDMQAINELGVDWYHIDIMDGNYVPNFAIGTDYLRTMTMFGQHPFYVHMMSVLPEKYLEMFAELGISYYCFHYETTNYPFRLCQEIRSHGMKPAVALNPGTPIAVLSTLIRYVDAVTLMSVEPGFSGQKFLPFTFLRISELKRLIGERNVLIEVDGGVNNQIAKRCLQNGCDVIVGGYFTLFQKEKSVKQGYREFEKCINE